MPCSTLQYGGKGALCTTTLMSGHRFIQTIHMLRSFFRHLSNTHIREYAFVVVALNKSRPMHQEYWFNRWPSLHKFQTLSDTSASRRGRLGCPKCNPSCRHSRHGCRLMRSAWLSCGTRRMAWAQRPSETACAAAQVRSRGSCRRRPTRTPPAGRASSRSSRSTS